VSSAETRIRIAVVFFTILFATLAVFAAVSAAPAPVVKDAQAHAPFTCKHGTVGHWTWDLKRHEVRYIRHWWTGGRHYHRYSYYTWTRSQSWVYHYRVTYDCTGAH
jgi:hypothetical protein